MNEPQDEAPEVQSLDDLGGGDVFATIQNAAGRRVRVRLRVLSEGEVWEIRKKVTWPEPPVKDYRKTGNDVMPVYDFKDKGFQQAQQDADRELSRRMLLASLTVPVEGETDDERLKSLQAKVGQRAFLQLLGAIEKLNSVTTGDIAAVARSFRPATDGRAPGDGPAGLEPEPVALLEPV